MDCSTAPVCAMWGGCSNALSGALPDGSCALCVVTCCRCAPNVWLQACTCGLLPWPHCQAIAMRAC
eukprot:7866981-Alexandrium_andersonii.AAC.1